MSRNIEVWADWRELGTPALMGHLRSSLNTDDHLRNHGFLLTDGGWVLSPAYDLNPTPDGTGLSLNISETDNATSFDLALEVAPYFRLKAPTAEAILHQVKAAVGNWKELANALRIARAEQEIMAPVFEG